MNSGADSREMISAMIKRPMHTMKRFNRIPLALLLMSGLMLVSCRGQLSDKSPVHPQQNMYFQERFNAQQENPFFDDGRAMRAPVEGTVARGQLREDVGFYEGVDEDGDFVDQSPVTVSSEFLYRGQNQYDVYCAVCHGGTGVGDGIIMEGQYGYVPAPTFHDDRIRNMPDGEIYSAIYNGVRTMPSFAHQIKAEDRWAIVAYIRALQQSRHASPELVAELGGDPESILTAYLTEAEEVEPDVDPEDVDAPDVDDADVSAERGEELFARQGCQACHSTDGTGGVGPTLQGLYQSERELVDGSTVVADEEYLVTSLVEPGAQVTAGYQNIMMPYAHLDEDEVLSLVEFIKSLADE